MLPLQYLSGWCLWQKLQRKRISNWVIWIKFMVFWLLWVFRSTLASSGSQLQRHLIARLAGHLRPRLSSDAQNRALPKNWSCIQILDTTLVLWILSAILLAIKSSVAPAFYKLIFSNSFKCICSSLFSVINFFNTFATYIFSYFLRQKLTPYV